MGISRSGLENYIICTSATRPGVPFKGLQIYETDTNRQFIYTGSAWVWIGGNPPRVRARRTTNQTLPNGTDTTVSWTSEDYDSDSIITPTASALTIPTGFGGLWVFEYAVVLLHASQGVYAGAWMEVNSSGSTRYGWTSGTTISDSVNGWVLYCNGAAQMVLSAGDTVSLDCFLAASSNGNIFANAGVPYLQGRLVSAIY